MQQLTNRLKLRTLLALLGLVAMSLFSSNQALTSPVPDLVCQWSAEGNANDSVGSNNGTLVNGATFAPGVVGQAFSLDGVDDVVRVPNSASLSFGPSSSMSVSLWAYRTGTARVMHLVSKRSGCGSFNYQMAFDGSGVGFGSPFGGAITNTTLALNTWTHLVGTFDGATFSLYLDGQLKATGAGTLGLVNSDDLLIGGAGTCGQTFNGLLDEVKLFDRALTPSEIQFLISEDLGGKALTYTTLTSSANSVRVGQPVTFTATVSSYAGAPDGGVEFFDGAASLGVQPLIGGTASITVPSLATGQHSISAVYAQTANYNGSSATLTVYARLTDQMGRFSYWAADGNAVDSISGHNGILENGATFAPGINGQAFYFDGVDDVMRIPYSPDFDLPSNAAMSVSLWAYRTGSASVMHLLGKRGSGWNYQMALDGSGIGFGVNGGATDPSGLPMNTWMHLVGTYDGATTRFYKNSQIVASALGGLGGVSTDDLLIGGSDGFERFAGLIDEVGFYDHALSPSEVLSIYNGGSGQNPSPMILGQVTRPDGTGVGNITVTLSGSATRTTITNANGWYTFGNLTAGGSYAVAASSSSYGLSPASQSINNLAGEQYVNFSASPMIDLSLALTDAQPTVVGLSLVYTISVTNNLPDPTAATLTSVLSGSGVFQNNGGCSSSDGGNHLTCELWIGGGTTTFQLFVMPTAPGTITSTMNVTGPFVDPNLSNNTVTKTTSVQALPIPTGSACVAPPSGAVAWYPGDGNANDIIAGHDGVLQNGVTFAPGIVGEAFSFDGVNSFVRVPNASAAAFGSAPFTIALWAKFNSVSFGEEGLDHAFISSEISGWVFWYEIIGSGPDSGKGVLHFSILSDGEKPPVVNFEHWIPEPERWYHLAVTRNSATYTLYINGVQVSSVNDPNGPSNVYNSLTIGNDRGATSFFNGLLDEITIYHRDLSAEEIQSIFNAGSYGQCKTASFTSAGQNVMVQTTGADLTFSQVTTTGTTSVVPIDPATAGQVPGGFAVSSSVAYEISSTASFTGPVTLAFKVPGPISQTDFNSLAILHNENGTLVDVTATSPARDYTNLTIYATTTSFSPFYLARNGPHINPLFDQTKAHKSGSTVPVKVQVLDATNNNLSSASTPLTARDLRLLGGNTPAPVVDSGNANPDSTFRYVSTLGGTDGYIFNLGTKGLAPGQYVLSFYVGSERSFFYTVKFEVK